MARKSVRRRKVRRAAKKSWLESLFTFPMLAVVSFVILAVFTVYQVTKPAPDVMGVVEGNDYQVYSRAEFEKIAANPTADDKKKYYFYVGIWKDADENAKYDKDENCLLKKFYFTINGNPRSRQIEDNFCEFAVVRSPNKCNTLAYDKNSLKTYKVTGLFYEDGVDPDPLSLKGKTQKYFCAGKYFYDLQYGSIGWGLKKK